MKHPLPLLLLLLYTLCNAQTSSFIDSSFGVNGRVNTHYLHRDYSLRLVQLADSTLLLAGNSNIYNYQGIQEEAIWVKYRINGKIDSTFAVNGKLSIDSQYLLPVATVQQPDGKLLLLSIKDIAPAGIYLQRYNLNGTIDLSFGQNGVAQPRFSSLGDYMYALTLDPDGKILLTGGYETNDNPFISQLAVVRLLANGKVDSTFGTDGIYRSSVLANQQLFGYNVYNLANDKILITGEGFITSTDQHTPFALRLLSNGIIDNTYGTMGKYVKYNSLSPSRSGYTILEPGGELIFVSTYPNLAETNRFLEFLCLDNTGHINTNYINGGLVSYDLGTDYNTYSEKSISRRTADGKIITGVWGDYKKYLLIRTNQGVIDSTFGINGIIADSSNAFPFLDMLLQNDNKIDLAGSFYTTGTCCAEDICIMRYHNRDTIAITGISNTPSPSIAIGISPNPFANTILVSLQKENLHQVTFTITNVLGQPVYTKREVASGNAYSKTLDLSYLPKGIYFLEIVADGERILKQLVKQ